MNSDYFKPLVWDVLIEAELTALFAAVPVLNVWPLRQIITSLTHLATDRIYAGLKLAFDIEKIVFLNQEHYNQFNKSVVTLTVIARDKGITSNEYLVAKENAKNALAAFVHFNG